MTKCLPVSKLTGIATIKHTKIDDNDHSKYDVRTISENSKLGTVVGAVAILVFHGVHGEMLVRSCVVAFPVALQPYVVDGREGANEPFFSTIAEMPSPNENITLTTNPAPIP
jgi:hypothetical protein